MAAHNQNDRIRIERLVKLDNKRDFENESYEGLSYYGDHNKPVEHLVLTFEKGDTDDLLKKFHLLQRKILVNSKWGWKRNIQFVGVVMTKPHYHAHILIRKPYVDKLVLIRYWAMVYKEGSHIEIKFVSKDKTKKTQMRRLVTYIMNNPEEHQSEDYYYFKSMNWGKK